MVEIRHALRDEIVNIFAMTHGIEENKYSHQIMLCKKETKLGRHKVYVLDPRGNKTSYKLSEKGIGYSKSLENSDFNLEYIAYIESFIEIPVVEELFEKLRIEGFFSIWNSKAPMKYFEDYDTGFLTLFRVYKIANSVPDSLLERGRKGSNYYFQLSDPYSSDVLCPVLSDKEYYKIKTELKSLLNSNNWLLYEYPINEMEDLLKIYPQEDYLEETDEEKYQEESNVYSDIKKIKEGPIEKSQYIQNERKMPTRKPEMAKSALINAKYLCEVNKVHKTFIYDKSGQDFMEAHHLIPMARYDDFKWSIDIPENIICLCPNCHRAIHKAKKEFKDKIIEEFYNKRKDLLLARGIDIDLDTLKKYYR